MLARRIAPVVGFLVMLGVTACSDSPTASSPEDVVAELAPEEAIFADTSTALTAERRTVPALAQLFRAALDKVRAEHGDDAVRRIVQPLHVLHREAREAWAAGNRPLARRKLEQARLEMARIVTVVFGPQVVTRVLAEAARGFEALRQRIETGAAAGEDVSRLRRSAVAIHRLLANARHAAASGRPAVALLQGTTALDLLALTTR